MSFSFEDANECFVTIADQITKTDPWGVSTTEHVYRRVTLAEVQARDTNQKNGSEVITIIDPNLPNTR